MFFFGNKKIEKNYFFSFEKENSSTIELVLPEIKLKLR